MRAGIHPQPQSSGPCQGGCVCVGWGGLGKLARVCAHRRRESGTSEAERPAGPTTQRGKLDFLRWLSDGTVGADGSLLTKA